MTVQEYVNQFEHLARFSAQNMTEEWRCLKFERGLKHEIKKVVTALRERRFPVLVEQTNNAEHLEKGPSLVASRHQKNVVEARQMKKPYSRPQTSGGPTCYKCGEPHLKRNCPQLTGGVGGSGDRRKCFICDKPEHFANNYPEKKSLGEKKPEVASPTERARALEPCLLLGHSVLVLFDSGATHSFISNACVGRLSLEKPDLGCELLVSTPSSGQVATSSVCVGCSMEVASRRFKVNLVCLPLEGLDVILGMEWLSNNHIMIDCGRHSLVFPENAGLELISTQQVLKELQGGAMCFMVVAKSEKKSDAEVIQSIPVASEYADVFPDEVSGLQPSRDIDFTIDLIPSAGPVFVGPYRMAPA